MDLIVTEGLTRTFGDLVAVDGLSLQVHSGEVFGLLGPNGAGKTTTLRMIAGLIGPTTGTVTVAGERVTDGPKQAQRARRLVGVLPEEVGLYPDLTVAKTLALFARLYHVPPAEAADRIDGLLVRFGLWDRRDAAAATLSKGLKQRLGLARALVHEPPVVLLDEPTANLDPEAATLVRGMLAELRADGRAVVVNTHRLDEAERVCDRVGVLRGRLVAVGTPDHLRDRSKVARLRVELEAWDPAYAEVVAAAGATLVRVDRATVTVDLAAGWAGTPAVVTGLAQAGAAIRAVIPQEESLEDAYLGLVGGAA
ncbi:ABC transporter ATP-binding protein [Actinotalea sp. M2MS4P-6]|uniref:ABC transporter ATP-binding protein n=1 Tax=Actinotalea sp. M2MS4P-6 TaxID=2983762 RepID=UPI0021E4AF26|nr:ABC transporter ATP-binding protein [Actinotalea sp. M2MS4P-6]MCV2394935.1 ABC transporter ATP-binding protein [Actinotalea sp. M2MS4P-6]